SEEEGFAKVLTKKGTDRIVGATIVAERAGDLIHEFVLAMKAGVGLRTISGTIHAYPTYAEIARKVADAQQKARLTPFAKRLLKWRWGRGGRGGRGGGDCGGSSGARAAGGGRGERGNAKRGVVWTSWRGRERRAQGPPLRYGWATSSRAWQREARDGLDV